MTDSRDRLIRISDAHKLLASRLRLEPPINRATIWRWINSGRLDGVRIGRRWYIWQSSIEKSLDLVQKSRE